MKTIHTLLIAMLASGAVMAEEPKPKPERPDRQIPPAVLKEFDKDGDGKLSESERMEMRKVIGERRKAHQAEMLKRFDADGDGKLSDEERKTAHQTVMKEMLAKYDADGNGKLEPEERRAMMEAEGKNPLAPFMRRPGGPRGEAGERQRQRPDGKGRQNPAPQP